MVMMTAISWEHGTDLQFASLDPLAGRLWLGTCQVSANQDVQ